MKTTQKIISAHRVTIPRTIREELGVAEGDVVELDIRPVEGGESRE